MAETQWGMVVDIDKCTGCQACVVACQSENNVPINEAVSPLIARGIASDTVKVSTTDFLRSVHTPSRSDWRTGYKS